MSTRDVTEEPVVPELEAIAAAAADELRALMDEARDGGQARCSGVPAAAGGDVLRRVKRAARRKREADDEYQPAIVRAGRLGLAQREIAGVAQVAHRTIRAIIARGDGHSCDVASSVVPADTNGSDPAHA